MKDFECIDFLRWALPRLSMRWQGFRKVRRQVCKRIVRRMRELSLPDIDAYVSRLETTPGEWSVLDSMCRITISRFFRDRWVFRSLEYSVLPALAKIATAGGEGLLRCWSAGCASGEEPYSLSLLWNLRLKHMYPTLDIRIIATDVDRNVLDRASRASYAVNSLKDLPGGWLALAFEPVHDQYRLKPEYRENVSFHLSDIRGECPEGPFHLVLCRNFVFTYFDKELQQRILAIIRDRLVPGGVLIIGGHEKLPPGAEGFSAVSKNAGCYRKK